MLRKIPAIQFTYDIWRAGSLVELGIAHRWGAIKVNRCRIIQMAVGYTDGHLLQVRPKTGYKAVMFFYNDRHFWTHMTIEEFNLCFVF